MVAQKALSSRVKKQSFKRAIIPYLFLLPHLIPFSLFFLIPCFTGIYAAFTDWKLAQAPIWEGFDNFKTLLFDDNSMFYYQLRWGLSATIKFVIITVPFQIIVPLLIALALNTKLKGSKVFQSLFYLPSLLSIAVVMISWNFMFDMNSGFINFLLNTFLGVGKLKWVTTEPLNWIAIVVITVWWVAGGNMIIYQSALAGIPAQLYEAASVDGANSWDQFWHITLPGLRYPLMYTTITGVIMQFGIYGQPLMFNDGGPTVAMVNGFDRRSNRVLLMYIFGLGFGRSGGDPGMASAMALIMGVIILIVSLVQFRLMRGSD